MRLALALVSLFVLAGCGTRPPAAAGETPVGHTYLSTAVTVAGRPHALVAGTRITLEFTRDGRLRARAGCNSLTGAVTLSGGRLDLGGQLAQTELGCGKDRLAQDEWLGGVLAAKPSWRLSGTRLSVRTGDTSIALLDRAAAAPDRRLEGPEWTVDTIIDGEVASSAPAGRHATLRFSRGRVLVFAGCNSGSAGYTRSGDTITFGRATMTRMACERDAMRLESAVLGVLDGHATYAVDADRLTLNGPSGKGLRLVAP